MISSFGNESPDQMITLSKSSLFLTSTSAGISKAIKLMQSPGTCKQRKGDQSPKKEFDSVYGQEDEIPMSSTNFKKGECGRLQGRS